MNDENRQALADLAENRPGEEPIELAPLGMTGGRPPGRGPTPMDDFIAFLCELYESTLRKPSDEP